MSAAPAQSASVQPAPAPPKSATVADCIDAVTWGVTIKKHAFKSESVDKRDFWFRKNDNTIHWASVGKRTLDNSHTILLSDVSELCYGKHTATFDKKVAAKVPEGKCFSVVGKKRSLDCELENDDDAAKAVCGIYNLLKRLNVKFTYKGLKNPPASENQKSGPAAKGDEKLRARLERIDTHAVIEKSDLKDSKDGGKDAKDAPKDSKDATSPTAAAGAAVAAAAATATPAPAAAAAPTDPEAAMRAKLFSEISAIGKANNVDYFVMLRHPSATKCYHGTNRQVPPREFAHMDAAVRSTTQLLNLEETLPNAADTAAKQRLVQCKEEIEAVRKELAETMDALHKLEEKEKTEKEAAAGDAKDSKEGASKKQ
jgi:hypothetical protein